ncbi:hypothetical protein ABKV19_002440 [Rosa sericea]
MAFVVFTVKQEIPELSRRFILILRFIRRMQDGHRDGIDFSRVRAGVEVSDEFCSNCILRNGDFLRKVVLSQHSQSSLSQFSLTNPKAADLDLSLADKRTLGKAINGLLACVGGLYCLVNALSFLLLRE